MSTSRSRKVQRRTARKVKAFEGRARRLPTCPVCQNKIVAEEMAVLPENTAVGTLKLEKGTPIHVRCIERLRAAAQIQSTERLRQSGMWLPGDE